MITRFVVLKFIHMLGATVLFGTGMGIAFFMWMAHRSRDAAFIAATAGSVVTADAVFTASAVVIQPISGVALAWTMGYSLTESWIVLSIMLYVVVGLCWLPVVWIQIKLRDVAAGVAPETTLPAEYARLFNIWFVLGWPAFGGVIAIVGLMIAKPKLW